MIKREYLAVEDFYRDNVYWRENYSGEMGRVKDLSVEDLMCVVDDTAHYEFYEEE